MNTKTHNPRGRPSKFTQAIAEEICERIARGEPLASICRTKGMPGVQTVSDWKDRNEAFSVSFARAREIGMDELAAQTLEIADDERNDWSLSKKGPVTNEVAIARARLRIDTRLKLIAKWDPKRYGERIDITQATKPAKPTREEFVADLTKSKALPDELREMLDEAEKRSIQKPKKIGEVGSNR